MLRDRVQLGRGDAGGNGEAHRAQRVGDHAPGRLEGGELLGGLDRHGRSIGTVVSTWRPAVMTRESQVRGRNVRAALGKGCRNRRRRDLVIAGIVIAIFWSLWIGIIVALVGLIAFGGFARGKWY